MRKLLKQFVVALGITIAAIAFRQGFTALTGVNLPYAQLLIGTFFAVSLFESNCGFMTVGLFFISYFLPFKGLSRPIDAGTCLFVCEAIIISIVAGRIRAVAIKARMHALHAETQDEENSVLHNIGANLSVELDMKRMLQMVTDAGTKLTAAKIGALFSISQTESSSSPFHHVMAYNISGVTGDERGFFEQLPAIPCTALFQATLKQKKIIRCPDIHSHPLFAKLPSHGLPQGHPIVRSYLAVPVINRNKEIFGMMLFGHPEVGRFTERHERLSVGLAAHAAIALDNSRLYEQRKRIADELLHAKETAEAANAAKDHFLAILSHELRNPLMPALLTVTSLQKLDLPDYVRVELEMIRRNIDLERRLVDDLLDVTRISRNKLHLNVTEVNIHEKIVNAITDCEYDAKKKMVSIRTDFTSEQQFVRGDQTRLRQIFWNLIGNAIQFTNSGGTVTIRTFGVAGNVCIEVIDTGYGIDEQTMSKIFTPFEQGGTRVGASYGGLGLGLYICKTLVESHRGTIQVRSDGRHKGATFVVTLPATVEPESQSTAIKGNEALRITTGAMVMLVEDHEDTLAAMKRVMETMGYQVMTANTYDSALEALVIRIPDLIISDIGLPDGNGYDLMRAIRERGITVPAIALTGFGHTEDRRKSEEVGFALHLTKPVNMDSLSSEIEGVLQKRMSDVSSVDSC